MVRLSRTNFGFLGFSGLVPTLAATLTGALLEGWGAATLGIASTLVALTCEAGAVTALAAGAALALAMALAGAWSTICLSGDMVFPEVNGVYSLYRFIQNEKQDRYQRKNSLFQLSGDNFCENSPLAPVSTT
jgi:hypothetical protein